jgi:uncharacterized protein YcfJ
MNKSLLISGCVCVLIISGCASNQTRVAEGTVIGGLLGAAAGGIIGHQSSHGREGALLGAAVGAAAGAVTGSQIEKPQQQPEQQEPQVLSQSVPVVSKQVYAGPNQLSVEQITAMVQQGVDDKVIVDKILLSGSRYNLSEQEIESLGSQGFSQFVINAMTRK